MVRLYETVEGVVMGGVHDVSGSAVLRHRHTGGEYWAGDAMVSVTTTYADGSSTSRVYTEGDKMRGLVTARDANLEGVLVRDTVIEADGDTDDVTLKLLVRDVDDVLDGVSDADTLADREGDAEAETEMDRDTLLLLLTLADNDNEPDTLTDSVILLE
jgi:hypothetical protein